MNNSKYRPEIDGLRTVAVVPVILFHLGYNWIKGGYYGVDVFFVISGFLITKIITEQIKNGKFNMWNFWLRRVKRLLPALFTVVATTYLLGIIFIYKPYLTEMGKDAIPALFSYSNFHAYFNFGSYWGETAENSFFLHTWSLSVEEQFYLLFPIILLFSYRFFRSFWIPLIIITFFSGVFFRYQLRHDQMFAFYMLPTRGWELAIGGIASILPIAKKDFRLALFGFMMMILPFFFDRGTLSLHAVFPVLGAAMVLRWCSNDDVLGRVLSSKPFVFIGKLSYSMYLWHWPLIILSKKLAFQLFGISQILVDAIIILLTILLSWLTYSYIENKTRNNLHTPKFVLSSAILLLFTGIYLKKYHGTNYISLYAKTLSNFRHYNITPKQQDIEGKAVFKNVIDPPRPIAYQDAYKKQGILKQFDNKNPEILLFGDSHGVMWAKTFREITDSLQISTALFTMDGDKPFIDFNKNTPEEATGFFTKTERNAYSNALKSNLPKWNPKIVVIACRWDNYPDQSLTLVKQFIEYFSRRNIKVVIMNQPPRIPYFGNENATQFFSYLKLYPSTAFGYIPNPEKQQTAIKGNLNMQHLTGIYPNVTFFDAYTPLTVSNKMLISQGNKSFYFDDDHLSYYGTSFLKPLLKKELIKKFK